MTQTHGTGANSAKDQETVFMVVFDSIYVPTFFNSRPFHIKTSPSAIGSWEYFHHSGAHLQFSSPSILYCTVFILYRNISIYYRTQTLYDPSDCTSTAQLSSY